jgi:hypothetical protein
MTEDEVNQLCKDIAAATLADEEAEEYLLAMGPRAHGPDMDEDAGPWWWEL